MSSSPTSNSNNNNKMKRSLEEKGRKKTKKRLKTKHMDPQALEVRRSIQQCCATNNLELALEIYEKAKSSCVHIEIQTFNNLLSLCDGLGYDDLNRRVHIGCTKSSQTKAQIETLPIAQRRNHAFRIYQNMMDSKVAITEAAYTALIRILIQSNELSQAQDLLREAQSIGTLKLRVYSSLLKAHCSMGHTKQALEFYKTALSKNFGPTEKEFLYLLKCAVQVGHAGLVSQMLHEETYHVPVPCKEFTKTLVQWFESSNACVETVVDVPASWSTEDVSLERAFPVTHHSGYLITHGCIANEGVLQNGVKLQLVKNQRWGTLLEQNQQIVLEGSEGEVLGGGKGKNKALGHNQLAQRKEYWQAFLKFAKSKKWDFVLDGANIGYYGQSYKGAPSHVNYHQIHSVVEYLLSQNKSVLLVLHQRHFQSKLMPTWASDVVEKWNSLPGLSLYKTPHGCNDDWFWFHACLQSGPGTFVVTNDLMRDHLFQSLHDRSLRLWREQHAVRFDFRSGVTLTFPRPYSRCIQYLDNTLVIPLPKQGDDGRYLDGGRMASDAEPIEERYICIQAK